MMNKEYLRNQAKTIRKAINEKDRKEYDKQIFELIINNDRFKNADKILLYCSYKTEISTQRLIDFCLENKKPLYLPYTDKNFNINFYRVDSRDSLIKNSLGILEPDISLCRKLIEVTSDTMCIVPMLAGNFKGHRLGYGKGCYDRFLKNFKGFKMGLVLSSCLFDADFSEKTDVPLNSFATENKVIYFHIQ